MKNNHENATGLLITLTFVGLFFVSLIVFIVADISLSSLFEEQVNQAINTEVQTRMAKVGTSIQAKGTNPNMLSNSLFYDLGLQEK